MKELFTILNAIYPLSPALIERLSSCIVGMKFKKGEIILREGETCKYIFFILKGLIRSYSILHDREVSNWFMKENDFCISVVSYFRQIPAKEFMVALEDTECLAMTHDQVEETYRLLMEYNIHGRIIEREYYIDSMIRQENRVRQTPYEKFFLLMEKDPNLVSRVNNNHLASFLDMSERTLNNVKKEYIKRKNGKKEE